MVNKSESKTERIFLAARKSFKENLPIIVVAKETGLSRSSITLARLILEFGSEQEITDAVSGKIGIRTIGDKLRKSLPDEAKESLKHRNGVWTPSRREELQSDSMLWSKFGPAIKQLTELPSAKDMLRVTKGNNSRELYLSQHLNTASNWLKEFMDEWNKYQQLKSEENTTDPGNGDTVAGTQHSKPSH